MVVKPLLVKSLVAVLALDPCVGGMTLALVVGQACSSESQVRAAMVIPIQGII